MKVLLLGLLVFVAAAIVVSAELSDDEPAINLDHIRYVRKIGKWQAGINKKVIIISPKF